MKLAIFGGTFNPPHVGHLKVARHIRDQTNPNRILWMPCSIPGHKSNDQLVSAEHRINMVRLAIESEPGMELSDFEIQKGGATFTIDTIEELKKREKDVRISWIIGSDNFESINTWRRIEDLVDLCEFLVIERPGVPLKAPMGGDKASWSSRLRYQFITGATVDVSSSGIREDIRTGKNVSHLLPPPVYDYILQFHLYQDPS